MKQAAPFSGLLVFCLWFFGVVKTLFHFFAAFGLRVSKKNESVFCALEWVGFFTNLFFLA
jgi:hypothetical protein